MATCSVPADIIRLLTPNLIGSQLNWALYGVLVVQLSGDVQQVLMGYTQRTCLCSSFRPLFLSGRNYTVLLCLETLYYWPVTASKHNCYGEQLWAVTTGICDIFIAASMTYHLSKKRTGFKKTDKLIDGIIRVIVETGSASVIVVLVAVVLTLGFSKYHYYVAPSLISSKVYSNSLLVVLNNRRSEPNGSEVSISAMNYHEPRGLANPLRREENTATTHISLQRSENERIVMVDLQAVQTRNRESHPSNCVDDASTKA
ncbi:hypothetical protein CONPUDRAFT_73705 [Coniophora puteana RWD-64-598 SS2]|uniref:DUF6534 domain-containing protein n=1 Tax=Coniophora puteana (strain RWD-64-598) TaxID=741705 RepID=A0A5M3MN68_CONPW|nr:uncharacterized protein CONPUDRAFT_73705 [Coniophora puteana RWD-64-598 SS2]EIW80618.1 hypothetical protein CONPUDRAFT_73705 [Coniophora puteana RWD-64-598 SS2]